MIPSTAHFIWYGQHFPWTNVLAIRSALQCGDFDRVILHHDGDLADAPYFKQLKSEHHFKTRPIDPNVTFSGFDQHSSKLIQIYNRLQQPAARSNMLRIAILAREGGVYLDLDTVTLRSLKPLSNTGFFCGEEWVIFPAHILQSRALKDYAHIAVLTAIRETCKRLPKGYIKFKDFEHLYYRAVNNAVIGAAPGHGFLMDMLVSMVDLDPKRQLKRFALGTHLLQNAIAGCRYEDITVHPPETFFPLPPEISRHWFYPTQNPSIDQVIKSGTYVVHWYASIRNRSIVNRISPSYVKSHAERQLFSALIARFIDKKVIE